MTEIPQHWRMDFNPVSKSEAIVQAQNVRFTVFASRLIRIEYSPTDTFEDRASQVFGYRAHPPPPFQVKQDGPVQEIETEHLLLRYSDSPSGFNAETLTIRLKETDTTWHFDDIDYGNLLGTLRTLDEADGYSPLEPGLMSRSGWTMVDDSETLVFDENGWLGPRNAPRGTRDLYFFGYGHAYQDCLRDYCKIAGTTPLLPRWVLGNWWSRYWEYTQDELTQLMRDFQEYQIPLSVCIVDMDWHITDTGNACSGWTGYTWNRDLFPDPEAFFAFLHENGLKAALNLHPAEGVHSHEAQYEEMAERVGIDPSTKEPVLFNIADPDFSRAYFEVLHHPYEAIGVDFWWIDWQQGETTALTGLDPLWWLNHLHFLDLGRDGQSRPFIFSRWGGLGNHRYPIGFSGDSHVTWASLAFQPYVTATAANVGFGWWSHDIGGHTDGVEDVELYTRWVQFGVFSPIMRLHSTKRAFHERLPWGLENISTLPITREVMQLRHALIPYLYTLSWRNETEAVPPIRPMYYLYPKNEESYACPQQYLFGDDLIVAPFTSPADPDTRLSRQVVWLPEGDWYDFFTGERVRGGGWQAIYGTLADIPVFARAGAIIPLGPKVGWGGVENPSELDVHVFAGADGQFALFEDDGETTAYQNGVYSQTKFAQKWGGDNLVFTAKAADGDTRDIPANRRVRLHVYGVKLPNQIEVIVSGKNQEIEMQYDEQAERLDLLGIQLSADDDLQITLSTTEASLFSHRDRGQGTAMKLLRSFRLLTKTKDGIAWNYDAWRRDPKLLLQYLPDLTHSQMRALLETFAKAGIHRVSDTQQPELIVLWNNQDREITCAILNESETEQGTIPRFKSFVPVEDSRWQVAMHYWGLFTVVCQPG